VILNITDSATEAIELSVELGRSNRLRHEDEGREGMMLERIVGGTGGWCIFRARKPRATEQTSNEHISQSGCVRCWRPA